MQTMAVNAFRAAASIRARSRVRINHAIVDRSTRCDRTAPVRSAANAQDCQPERAEPGCQERRDREHPDLPHAFFVRIAVPCRRRDHTRWRRHGVSISIRPNSIRWPPTTGLEKKPNI